MVGDHPEVKEIWEWLRGITDPEIPVLSVSDLGLVRDIRWNGPDDELVITITPTYSGCPAIDLIAADIRSAMKERGIERLKVETKLSPAWTTDWMTEEAKERLRTYGIAPPPRLVQLNSQEPAIVCPQCGSSDTALVSRFGSTPCKSLYRCLVCLEPFDAFKRH